MKGFHKGKDIIDSLVLDGSHKSRNVFVVVVKGASDNSGFLYHIGYGYFFQILFFQKQKKRIINSFVGHIVPLVLYFVLHINLLYFIAVV